MFARRGLFACLAALFVAEFSVAVRKGSGLNSRYESVAEGEAEWGGRRRGTVGYFPRNGKLMAPNDGPTLSFYMYRSQGPATAATYPLENVNTASIGGVMWYLHNEIIFTCTGAGGVMGSRSGGSGIVGQRKFGITRIRRFKVTMKATQPLLRRGMNFSMLCSYDAGECTGPFRSIYSPEGEFNQFGYTIGCGRIGDWPHTDWASGKTYPDAIWYSLPGPCPTKNYKESTKECNLEQPGGHCKAGQAPTGAGDCTYQYEEAGEIDIDELVGITPKWSSRAEFCKQCEKEGDALGPGGCGLNFWGANISDEVANHKQVEAALRMFEKKYPDSPKAEAMPAQCDWAKFSYFRLPWR